MQYDRPPQQPPAPAAARARAGIAGTLALAATATAGCSSASDGPASLMTASLAASAGSGVYAAPPTEVYSRIARGALKCWFGRNGSLKGSHVFHADADSPVKGGAAEIVVFERDQTNQNPRGLRTLRITITPAGEGAHVGVDILRVEAKLGARMREDVIRWAGGSNGCGDPITQGWNTEAAPHPAPNATRTPPAKRKVVRTPRK